MATNVVHDDELSKLKLQIQSVLSESDGIESGSFWNYFIKKNSSLPDPKKFKVTKRSDLLELCSDVITVTGSGNTAKLSLKKTPAPTDAISHRRGGDAELTGSAVAKKKTAKAEILKPASQKKIPKKRSTGDNSVEAAVEKLEFKPSEMQPSSQASFYEKFYDTSTSHANVSAAGSHQENTVAKAYTSLQGIGQSDGFVKRHYLHGAGDVRAVSPGLGLLGPGPGHASVMMSIRPNVSSVCSDRILPGTVIHRGFSAGPLTAMSAEQQRHTSNPFALSHETAVGSNDSSSSYNGSWQQLTQNAMFHIVKPQPSVVRPSATSNTIVTGNSSHRSLSQVSATGGRKMNFSKQQINSAAEDCIDRLSAAKDYVSFEKIEKLLLQHFEVDSLQQLYLRHLEEISCVNDHVRMLCKVNTYIQNFIKVRTICTVFELHEALREFAPNRGDFDTLKLGPLTKLPLIYEYFKFPPEAEICEITTADVIEDLRLYLTEKNAWTAQLNLEDLLKFMMEKRDLATPYELGLRIKSPALAIQMLKKAQRDCGTTVRSTSATLSQGLERELDAAFRNFQVAVMRKEVNICTVREEYCSMDPRDLVGLVFTKLRQLYQMVFHVQISWDAGHQGVAMSAAERKKQNRVLELVNNFVAHMGTDELLRKLFKVAICCSQEQIHNFEFVRERSFEQCEVVNSDVEDTSDLRLPNIGEVIKSVKKYLERVVAQGSITLDMLSKIEQKLLSDFNLKYFTLLQQGSFLEFLLRNDDFKKVLEEHGGSLTGSSLHSGVVESIYHAAVDDLVEFIKQCATKEVAVIETAVCHHYGCKDVKTLGHGPISSLLNKKRSHQQGRDSAIFFDSALAAKQISTVHGQLRTVGLLGHITREKALACLQNCPLLADLAEWSHWDMVFKPQLKDLKDFIHKHGFVYQCTVADGSRNVLVTTDLVALEVRPGSLLRLTTRTSPEIFGSNAVEGNARSTSGHLMSLIAQSRGIDEAPLVLLGNHVKTALLKMQSRDTDINEDYDESRVRPHIQFVLDCLTHLPLVTGHLVIKKVFLDALSDVVGQARSKQLLLQHAKTYEQLTKLQAYGMLLGIQEWTESFQLCTVFPKECMEAVGADLGPIIQNVHQSDSEDESESESDMEISISDDSDEDSDDSVASVKNTMIREEAVAVVADAERIAETSAQKLEEQQRNESGEFKSIPDVIPTENDVSSVIDIDSNFDVVTIDGEETSFSPTRQFIDVLRREEFGVNVELSDDGKRLMDKQHERLGRSLERLSADLYSKDTHFVLELIQNADDNEYHPVMLERDSLELPSLRFSVDPDCITVFNNETGFREKNIRAVCDVGKTTKGKHKFGYIGQKGIGFKSVFRVTERPEIHSNGFHIKFDVNSGPLGYILPHWIEDDDVCKARSSDKWTTCIRLPLRSEMQQRAATKTLAARFRDIQPSLLLFLHRLRSIAICNKMESYESVMTRKDLSNNIVEITHRHGSDRWLVVRKMLDASKISLQAKSGVEIESTELALAFPLLPKTNLTAQIQPPKQPVFAFLPLRSYGFRFIVQGDFDVPSSREEVDRDSMWNQWLRSEIAMVFVSALDSFIELKQLDTIEAIASFLQFVPLEGEILDFFTPVTTNIFQQLRAKSCLPTQGLQWRLPSQLVVTSDHVVREVVSGELLHRCLNLDYLHPGVAALLNSQMMRSLGVQTLNTQHLLEVGKQIVARLSGTDAMLNDVDIISVSKWLLCLHKSMDEFGRNEETLKCLKSMRMIPLSSGRVTSIDDETVFFPLSMFSDKRGTLSILEADMQIVHPLLLGSGNTVDSQICSLLEQLGVKRLTPRDVISHHILPTLRTDAWKSKSDQLVVIYMTYIMEQYSQQSSIVNMDELRPLAVVLTNARFVRPAEQPVHFTPEFGNCVDLAKQLPGFGWTLIDQCYIKDVRSKLQVEEWRKFFSSFGVLDFLAVKQQDVTFTHSELSKSMWSEYAVMLPSTIEEFRIADYQCEEFVALVECNTNQSSLAEQMKLLFQFMNRDWESQFKKYTITKIMDKAGHTLREVDTSFSMILKNLSWIPATVNCKMSLLRGPELFIKTPQAERLLSSHVPFLFLDNVSSIVRSTFCSFLGISNDISVDFVADCLKDWCRRDSDNKLPAEFSTSLAHVRDVYQHLSDNMPRVKFGDLVKNHPVIFYVDPVPNDMQSVNKGKFLMNSEVVWLDPTCLFSKYHESLVAVSPMATNSLCRYMLQPVYPDKEKFFCGIFDVRRTPDVGELLKLMIHITSTCTVQRALSDVLCIFTTIGKHLTKDDDGSISNVVKKHLDLLNTEAIIPTKKNIWVRLTDCPMIADDKKLEKLFAEQSGVNFVDSGEKIGVGAGQRKATAKDARDKDQNYILKFLGEIGVRRLTDCVEIEPQTENFRPCPGLQAYVRQMVPWIQRCLYADEYRDIYDFLVASGIKARLAAMTFAQVGKLELVYRLSNLPEIIPIIFEEKCRMVSDKELHVHFEHVSSYNEINRELSRYFSCLGVPGCPCPPEQTDQCFRELKLVLGALQPLLSLSPNELDSVMQQHDYGSLPTSEELWEVKEPMTYMPQQPRVVKEWVACERPETPMDVSSVDESSGIRSWPPKSHENMGLAQGVKSYSSSSSGSTMWPPPAPPQNMDRSQLPSNLRPSSLPRPNNSEKNDLPGEGETKSERSVNQLPRSPNVNDDRPHTAHCNVGEVYSSKSANTEKDLGGVSENQNRGMSGSESSSKPQAETTTNISAKDASKENTPMLESKVNVLPAAEELMNVAVDASVVVTNDTDADDRLLELGSSYEEPMVIEFTRSRDVAVVRAGNKRARVNSDSNLTEIIRQPFVKQPVTIYGPPIWLSEVEECVYEQLGQGNSLELPTDITLSDDSDTQIIGQWGEMLVNSYLHKLCAQRQNDGGPGLVSFVWTNQDTQKGLPYDFELVYHDDSRVYVEVKSTRSDQKACFGISIQQVMFAQEMGPSYHLYRVYCAGDTKNVRLASIDNVAQRLISKQLRLFMAL